MMGNMESTSELCIFLNNFKPILGDLIHHPLGRNEEVSIGPIFTASHPSPELVELGESESICAVNNNGVGSRDIQTGFDNRCAEEKVKFVVVKIKHGFLK